MPGTPPDQQASSLDCITCGEPASYHRCMLDIRDGGVLGSLCTSCETSTFGSSIDDGLDELDGECDVCGRIAAHALVDWVPEETHNDGIIEVSVEAAPQNGGFELCDDHLFGKLLEDATSFEDWSGGEISG